MLASEAVEYFGDYLLGKYIMLQPMGNIDGGIFEIIDIQPDSNAPDIALGVEVGNGECMGVFNHETIHILLTCKNNRMIH